MCVKWADDVATYCMFTMLYPFPCTFLIVVYDFHSFVLYTVQFGFPATEPGVPYNITVRASTAAGRGEPVSIVVFVMQEGNSDQITMFFKGL